MNGKKPRQSANLPWLQNFFDYSNISEVLIPSYASGCNMPNVWFFHCPLDFFLIRICEMPSIDDYSKPLF